MSYLLMYLPCSIIVISVINVIKLDSPKAAAIKTAKDFGKLTIALAAACAMATIISIW